MAAMSESPSRAFKIALVQMSCVEEVELNVRKAEKLIREAAQRGAKLVCLQELFASVYFCQNLNHSYFRLAEAIPGPLTERFSKLAQELTVVILLPVYEKRAPGLYFNSCAVIDADGSLKGVYRKMHIPHDPQFEEKFYFAPGDLGFKAWDTAVGRIGVLICWDQWYPEGARLTALHGAEILFYPTAIGWLAPEKEEFGERQYRSWEVIQRSHAVANGCYVAAPNRCGFEAPNGSPGIEFWGRSFVADPSGTVVAQASTGNDEVLIAEVDLDEVRAQREVWPFLRDRRVDAYGDLGQRFLG